MKVKSDALFHTSPQTRNVESIEIFLSKQQQLGLLRFITCGSVDDGKSTLIGRMLWESQHVYDDQMMVLKQESKKHGTQAGQLDFALLVDGLTAEREQGITIDVAYRFFATDKRKYIVADSPGHEQYTRNMITGASTAHAAVILVDARKGILTQTRRHTYLVSLMGVPHVILAVNKMDLVAYSSEVFIKIKEEFENLARSFEFNTVAAVPLSALKGDNIIQRSLHTPWYLGATLLGYLETLEVPQAHKARLIFPVQWVNRPNSSFRGFSGCIAEGSIKVADEIRVTATNQTAKVSDIVTMDGNLQKAERDQAITLVLDREIDISRGDVITHEQDTLEKSDQFEATIVWMHEEAGLVGRLYDLKLGTQWSSASITAIKYRVNVNTFAHEPQKKLELNDICVCNIATSKPVVFDIYSRSKTMGGFILVDRFTHATMGVGLIRHGLRRSQNIHKQALTVDKMQREKLNGHKGKVVWFTGLSGSGKSTIANALEVELHAKGYHTYLLDGDNIRHGLNHDLGFTDADRVENIRRVIEVAKLMLDAGLIVITAFISPFKREREMAKELIGTNNFIEVYVNTPLEICEKRDKKGLYKKARAGQLPNMSGIGSPYEVPQTHDIEVDGAHTDVKVAVKKIYDRLLIV